MKVLHVTEASAAGVLSFVDVITRAQVACGALPSVLYAVRAETPDRDALEARFADGVELCPAINSGSTARNLIALGKAVRRLAQHGSFEAIHLHSAKAGLVGRIATAGTRARVVYSPHGFPFLRLNTSKASRRLTRLVERLLARRGGVVVTSRSEEEIARHDLHAASVHYLRSGVWSDTVRPRTPIKRATPRVVMVGRMSYQKAPWRFAAVARALSATAEFTWIGGDDETGPEWIGDAPVTRISWVDAATLQELIDDADIMLFPTLWEGFSLSLVQAQAAGLPAVTSDAVGNRDAVEHGVTGFVCNDDDELIEATRKLIADPLLRERMGAAAQRRVHEQFLNDAIGRDSISIYHGDV